MKMQPITTVKTASEASDIAIDWQNWVGEQNQIGEEPTLYTSDLVEWYDYFTKLATKFNLTDEFKENGIL